MKTVKTILATTSVFLCFSFVVWGQPFKVNNDKTVNFGSAVTIYTNPTALPTRKAMSVSATNVNGTRTLYGISSTAGQGGGAPNGDCVGIYGAAHNPSHITFPARYIGVLGEAIGGYTSGNKASIGVCGIGHYYGNSVAIYGKSTASGGIPSVSFNFPGASYAGYFEGPVNITGTLTAINCVCSSDERLKRNIEALGKENIIEKLSALRPVKYNLRQIERGDDSINAKGEKVTFKIKRFDEEAQYFKKEHYGLVAQELQKVYPELVYEEGDGYLSINYTGLIPLLLQAIQEQQKQIEELQTKNPYYFIDETEEDPTQLQPSKAPQQQTNSADNMLYQNAPNPFNISTTIKYQLSDNATNAKICIYNLTGKQLQCYNLSATKGENSIEVSASSLQAGMYLYSLIVDDKLISTKRMILTE